jgi:2-polyprenyl-3-methyl-5-hydroxy-6-metoxy-1,4-benzoquinol methylase
MAGGTLTTLIDCPLCQSPSFNTVFIKFDLAIVRCRACGFMYTNPRLAESEVNLRYGQEYFFGEYLPIFQAGPASFSLEVAKNHYRLYLDLLAALDSPGKRLLDVGCGAGFFLKAAASSGWEVSGTEISEAAADYARTVTGVRVFRGKLEELHLPAKEYDVVTMLDLLEHLFEPLTTLREVRRVMKDGAVLIISTPDIQSLSRCFLGQAWAVLSPAEHQSYFSAKTLRRALGQAGFRPLAVKNLLNFNPDYTHQPGSFRHRLWKTCSRGLKRTAWMQKIHRYEHLDLPRSGRGLDSSLPPIGTPTARKKIFGAAKAWLRGDILVAVAEKAQASEKTSR